MNTSKEAQIIESYTSKRTSDPPQPTNVPGLKLWKHEYVPVLKLVCDETGEVLAQTKQVNLAGENKLKAIAKQKGYECW